MPLPKSLPRNNGTWSEARYTSFIKSGLRAASQRWGPRYAVLNAARRGKQINPKSGRIAEFYECAACHLRFPGKDVEVNHIIPVVPITGWDTWDGVISRLFCEAEGLEVVCKPCHKRISTTENTQRKQNK